MAIPVPPLPNDSPKKGSKKPPLNLYDDYDDYEESIGHSKPHPEAFPGANRDDNVGVQAAVTAMGLPPIPKGKGFEIVEGSKTKTSDPGWNQVSSEQLSLYKRTTGGKSYSGLASLVVEPEEDDVTLESLLQGLSEAQRKLVRDALAAGAPLARLKDMADTFRSLKIDQGSGERWSGHKRADESAGTKDVFNLRKIEEKLAKGEALTIRDLETLEQAGRVVKNGRIISKNPAAQGEALVDLAEDEAWSPEEFNHRAQELGLPLRKNSDGVIIGGETFDKAFETLTDTIFSQEKAIFTDVGSEAIWQNATAQRLGESLSALLSGEVPISFDTVVQALQAWSQHHPEETFTTDDPVLKSLLQKGLDYGTLPADLYSPESSTTIGGPREVTEKDLDDFGDKLANFMQAPDLTSIDSIEAWQSQTQPVPEEIGITWNTTLEQWDVLGSPGEQAIGEAAVLGAKWAAAQRTYERYAENAAAQKKLLLEEERIRREKEQNDQELSDAIKNNDYSNAAVREMRKLELEEQALQMQTKIQMFQLFTTLLSNPDSMVLAARYGLLDQMTSFGIDIQIPEKSQEDEVMQLLNINKLGTMSHRQLSLEMRRLSELTGWTSEELSDLIDRLLGHLGGGGSGYGGAAGIQFRVR